jgi:hypothetical protein
LVSCQGLCVFGIIMSAAFAYPHPGPLPEGEGEKLCLETTHLSLLEKSP